MLGDWLLSTLSIFQTPKKISLNWNSEIGTCYVAGMAITCSQAHRPAVGKVAKKGRRKRKKEQERMILNRIMSNLRRTRILQWRMRRRGYVDLERSVWGMWTAATTSLSCFPLQTPSQTQTMTKRQSFSECLSNQKYVSIWKCHWLTLALFCQLLFLFRDSITITKFLSWFGCLQQGSTGPWAYVFLLPVSGWLGGLYSSRTRKRRNQIGEGLLFKMSHSLQQLPSLNGMDRRGQFSFSPAFDVPKKNKCVACTCQWEFWRLP